MTFVIMLSLWHPPLVSEDGSLLFKPEENAFSLMAVFDNKQCREEVTLPPTCHTEPSMLNMAFRSRGVKKILAGLDSFGGTEPLGLFPLLLKEAARVLAPKLSTVFRLLFRQGVSTVLAHCQHHTHSQECAVPMCLKLSSYFNYSSSVKSF